MAGIVDEKKDLRFPSNIAEFPTFMQYTAYKFEPTESGERKKLAFGNVGAVQTILSTIYLPSQKSEITETQQWASETINNPLQAMMSGVREGEGGMDKAKKGLTNLAGVAGNQLKLKFGTDQFRPFAVLEQQALKYNGPEQRSFTCNYTFVSRSEEETQIINNIIRTFRYHSAPTSANYTEALGVNELLSEETGKKVNDNFGNIGIRTYGFPSLFKVSWMTGGTEVKPIDWLPVYDTCYCDSVSVSYGGDKFTTFHNSNGAPTTYSLTLSFKELEFSTKDTIKKTGLGG